MSTSPVMSWDEYTRCDATALAALIRGKDISPAELAHQVRCANDRVNAHINAVIEIFADAIEHPERQGMAEEATFYGVPMMMKDLGSRMRGRQQENGYAWQSNYIADEDDPLTRNFRQAGFNLVGRTTTPEDGMAGVTETIKFGITRNPWDLNRSAGGSSGGSAAVVSARVLPVSSASDGGGSIRLPASWNGLVGLKCTRGRLPLPSGLHEAVMPSASEGLLSRSVRDTAFVHDYLCHKPEGSGFMPYPMCQSLSEELDAPERKFRIAVSSGNWSRSATVPTEYRERIAELATWLQERGHSVLEVEESDICSFERLFESYRIANWLVPIGHSIPAMADAFGVTLDESNTSRQALQLIEMANGISTSQFLEAMAANVQSTREWGQFWAKGFDLLLTPTLGDRCPEIQSNKYALSSSLAFADFFDHGMDLCRYTMPGNDTGLPAISLPMGLDRNNCPMGMQFYAPWAKEHDLIHIAAQMERGKSAWFDQHAPLTVANVE